MNWNLQVAKNNEFTLSLNGIRIYSNYRPSEDVAIWMESEINRSAEKYILIGLGVGYHLKELSNRVNNKEIIVYYFDQQELEIFMKTNTDYWWKKRNIKIVSDFVNMDMGRNTQLLIPNVWLKAIGLNHPLHSVLEVIKINQVSFKKHHANMEKNFYANIARDDDVISNLNPKRVACLVAAGPSLDETISWLKKYQSLVDIYVVGAALKTVMKHGIIPKAAVLSDQHDMTSKQFDGLYYEGILYYLSTASAKTVANFKGETYILFQEGYHLAELEARKRKSPLLKTGGSVGTTTFSLLEHLGYETIVLFGQDLGFVGNKTHADESPSKTEITLQQFKRDIEANDGTLIHTNAMFHTFWYWYEQKCKHITINVYNTAAKGAKISNVPLIDEAEFKKIIRFGF